MTMEQKKKRTYEKPTLHIVPLKIEHGGLMQASKVNFGEGSDIDIHGNDDPFKDGQTVAKQRWGAHWDLWEDDTELQGSDY